VVAEVLAVEVLAVEVLAVEVLTADEAVVAEDDAPPDPCPPDPADALSDWMTFVEQAPARPTASAKASPVAARKLRMPEA
jgi:hypothetical protein